MAGLNGDSQAAGAFSWRDAHPTFVVFLVGPDENPFGIQRDFLNAHSDYFKTLIDQLEKDKENKEEKVEYVVAFPDMATEVFGLVQNFLYTGRLFSETEEIPGYDVLIETWKAGDKFEMPRLCDKALAAMVECRRVTQSIPATPLLVKAWKETPERSNIRRLILNWAAEYIQASDSRAEFSKSLPQEVLSELVIAMSHMKSAPIVQFDHVQSPGGQAQYKNIHYLQAADSGTESSSKAAKKYQSDVPSKRHSLGEVRNGDGRKSVPGLSRAVSKPVKHRRSSVNPVNENQPWTTEQKLLFCRDLINRMLSGPGFWTRFVGPFKVPVDPVADDVPDYFEKVTKPMDLGTVQSKMERGEYANEDEFATDVRQIFANCYAYWPEEAPMWAACKKLENRFEEQYVGMKKWLAKLAAEDAA